MSQAQSLGNGMKLSEESKSCTSHTYQIGYELIKSHIDLTAQRPASINGRGGNFFGPVTEKLQLNLSAEKIALKKAQQRLQTTNTANRVGEEALRRKSAPTLANTHLLTFSIAPRLTAETDAPFPLKSVPKPPQLSRLRKPSVAAALPPPAPLLPTNAQLLAEVQGQLGTNNNNQATASSTDSDSVAGCGGGSSTSPESLLDNILSGASSVSVQSSSASETMATGSATASTVTVIKTHANRLQAMASPELRILPPTPDSESAVGALAQRALPMPKLDLYETGSQRSRSRTPSPSPSLTPMGAGLEPEVHVLSYPEELKCGICLDVYTDPRTLNCLHSFCFQCLVDQNFKQDGMWTQSSLDINSSYSLRSSTPEMSLSAAGSNSNAELATISPARQRGASFSLRRKKSQDKMLLKPKLERSNTRLSESFLTSSQRRIVCSVCKYTSELPLGGVRLLPQNYLLVRKIEALRIQAGEDTISRVWCSLCSEESSATYHCITCTLNLCTLCKEAHERQRSTASHRMKSIMELRRARKQKQQQLGLGDNTKMVLRCGIHQGLNLKSFCVNCLQLACADCLVLLHKGHKHEGISKALNHHGKLLRDTAERTRPLCNYAEHSIEKLNEIARNINRKCDEIQGQVDTYMQNYFDALEVHRRTLLQQVHRARESKIEMILEQQIDLEKRTQEALDAVRFSQELCDVGADVEILSFMGILLKRLEYCQQFKTPVDPKISHSLHFLPKIRAPSTKDQNDIPLYGIITMQTVEPALCTLQWEGFSQLRLHKKVDLLLVSRDVDGVALCHGGLQINCMIKPKDSNSKFLPIEVSDHRDGTYSISFTPDAQGTLILTITINEKSIKGSPFTFQARQVRPHSGIFHCCTFCSAKGNKIIKCSCDGRMPGYTGCGHGHAGHPGRRHWSCCGNVLENSECNVANKLLNT